MFFKDKSFPKFLVFFWIIAIGALASCKHHPEKIPGDILPDSQMVSILADIHVAEAAVRVSKLNTDSFPVRYNSIFQEHHVSNSQFKKSFVFYSEHPVELEKIYDEVINELSRRQAGLVRAPLR